MTEAKPAWQVRREQVAQERSQWPAQYASVREAIGRGFVPFAYGNIDRSREGVCAPPTKFSYPAGGIAHPFHVDGFAAGARLWIWSFARKSPDEIRDEQTWHAGETNATGRLQPSFLFRGGCTLPEAFDAVEQMAADCAGRFILPIWRIDETGARRPTLPTAVWREIASWRRPKRGATPAFQQASLFGEADWSRPRSSAQVRLAEILAPVTGDVFELSADIGTWYDLDVVIADINWHRSDWPEWHAKHAS